MTYASLCTGYDGIGRGLKLAGERLSKVFHAENEVSVARVLDPSVPNLGDIKKAVFAPYAGIDLLSSGDPCQSISIAGRQLGREDPRFLWPWVREAYRELRPRRIFLENVANMVSHDEGRTMAERFLNLREDKYAVSWTVIGACAVGAPHHRHRWYALAEYAGPDAPEAVRVPSLCGARRPSGRIVLPTPNAREGGERGFPSREHAQRRADNPQRSLNLEDAVALLPADGWGKYADAVSAWEEITGVPAPTPTVPGPKGGLRLNPEFPEWMMGLLPGTLTMNMDRRDALRAAGNGVVPQVSAAAWKLLTA